VEDPGEYCFRRDLDLVLVNDIDFLIVEVKKGLGDINPSWREVDRTNVQYALRWMGFTNDENEIKRMANKLHANGGTILGNHSLRLVVICGRKNDVLQREFPELTQIILEQVTAFIQERLTTGCARLQRDNWDDYIQEFAKRAEGEQSVEQILDWTREIEDE
jgi:hypothetical protein